MRRFSAAVLLVVGLAGCAGSPESAATSAADSSLARDIALASEGTLANGALGDTALSVPAMTPDPTAPAPPSAPVAAPRSPTVAPTPRAPVPAPPPAVAASPEPAPAVGPAPARRSLGAGTALTASTTTRICSRTNRPGDKLVGTLTEPITVSDGSTIPAGTSVVFEVADAQPNGEVALRVRAISVQGTSVPLEGTTTAEGTRESARVPNGDDKGKVVRGAIIGAIAGRILGGGSKGAIIGAAGGAAVGTAQAMKGAGSESCLSPGATVRVTLASSVTLP
jgi:hypothetical protein